MASEHRDTAPLTGINAGIEKARAGASELEPDLQRAYERELRAAGREAAARFEEKASIVAAANWEPPTVEAVLQFRANTDRIQRLQRAMLERIAGIATGEILGVSFDVSHEAAQRLLDQMGLRAADIAADLRTPVANAIAEGWAEGKSVPQTAALIRQSVNGLSKSRAEMLARTDLIGLSNGSGQIAVQQLNEASEKSGKGQVIKTKTWLTAGDGRVRPTHEEANEQTVPIDQPYFVGGFRLNYPGDPSGPSDEVVRCRCTEIYNEEADVSNPSPPKQEGQPGRSQLVNQLLGNADDTRGRWLTATGTYSPERQALHRQIVEHFLGAGRPVPAGQRPRSTFMAGGSGAGKSTVKKAITERGELPKHYVDIDPDGIKEMLPEYQQLIDAGEKLAARSVHEESSDIAKMVLDEAMTRRMNVVIDGTGNSEPGKFVGKLLKQEAAGYEVDVVMVDVRTAEAVARAVKRAERTGRYVPEKVIRQIHRDVAARFEEWRDIDAVKRWQLWDNNDRPPKLVAERRESGIIRVNDENSYKAFLRKADESLERPDTPLRGTAEVKLSPAFVDREIQQEVNDALANLSGSLPDRALQKLKGLRDEKLPVLKQPSLSGGAFGRYTRETRRLSIDNAEPAFIELSQAAPHPGMTLLHEFGHYLDNLMVQRAERYFGSVEALAGIESSGVATDAYRNLFTIYGRTQQFDSLRTTLEHYRKLAGDPLAAAAEREYAKEAAEHIEYLLSPVEVWARAFAQFMARRHGGTELKRELEEMLDLEFTNRRLPMHWANGQQADMMIEAVEQVLRDLGLLDVLPPVTAGGDARQLVSVWTFTGTPRSKVVRRTGLAHAVSDERRDDLLVAQPVEQSLTDVESRGRHSPEDRSQWEDQPDATSARLDRGDPVRRSGVGRPSGATAVRERLRTLGRRASEADARVRGAARPPAGAGAGEAGIAARTAPGDAVDSVGMELRIDRDAVARLVRERVPAPPPSPEQPQTTPQVVVMQPDFSHFERDAFSMGAAHTAFANELRVMREAFMEVLSGILARKQEPPVVNLTVPVEIEATRVEVPVTVEVPPQLAAEPPVVNVEVQPTPVEVNVTTPPRSKGIEIERDASGNVTGYRVNES